jgi:hypothetical protein
METVFCTECTGCATAHEFLLLNVVAARQQFSAWCLRGSPSAAQPWHGHARILAARAGAASAPVASATPSTRPVPVSVARRSVQHASGTVRTISSHRLSRALIVSCYRQSVPQRQDRRSYPRISPSLYLCRRSAGKWFGSTERHFCWCCRRCGSRLAGRFSIRIPAVVVCPARGAAPVPGGRQKARLGRAAEARFFDRARIHAGPAACTGPGQPGHRGQHRPGVSGLAAGTWRARRGTRGCAEPGGWYGADCEDEVWGARAARYHAGRGFALAIIGLGHA